MPFASPSFPLHEEDCSVCRCKCLGQETERDEEKQEEEEMKRKKDRSAFYSPSALLCLSSALY